jgi:hypothetical protein
MERVAPARPGHAAIEFFECPTNVNFLKGTEMKTHATHTLHAISEHFEIDRSTAVRMLRGVKPDGGTEGRPTWKISTAAKALEAHHRKSDGGNGSGTDPDLQRLYDEHAAAEARLRALPTVAARREAARRMIPQIVEMDKATRRVRIGRGQDAEAVHLNADAQLRLCARGIEGPCEWDHDQVWTMFNEASEDA